MNDRDAADLKLAKALLEQPGFAVKAMNAIGKPLEKGFERLPAKWQDAVASATRVSLLNALSLAARTMDGDWRGHSSNLLHKAAVVASGAGGGAFGLAALPIELPISTVIMMRSIADVARSEGESVDQFETRLACLEVFALGGGRAEGYLEVKAALAKAVTEAATFIAEKGIVEEGAPAIVRLVAMIGSRFGVAVSEKAAAQIVPVVGAVSGAAINLLFIDHFQDVARGHFTVRRLERTYGVEEVERAYKELPPPSA